MSLPSINVILSGGIGSRLWPLSRKSRPKQYIPLLNEQSLFQICANRNSNVATSIVVVGNTDNYTLSRTDLSSLGVDNFTEIVEAAPRNTAAAIAFAAFAANPDDIMLVTPSDHVITGDEEYASAVKEAARLAGEGYLVTFGIVPARPETGYGYIEFSGNDVVSFQEKPKKEVAQQFVESGRYVWNSGMFCFRADTYLEELKRYEPELFAAAKTAWDKREDIFLPLEETMAIPSVSVDYAVMERSDKIKVIPASFGWSDLGSFESLWEYMESDGAKSGFVQKNLVLGTKKHVEFIGVEGLVVVETEDAILVLPKEHSQFVKQVYERLEKEKPELLK